MKKKRRSPSDDHSNQGRRVKKIINFILILSSLATIALFAIAGNYLFGTSGLVAGIGLGVIVAWLVF